MTRLAALTLLLAAAPAAAQETAVQASTAAVQLSTEPVQAQFSPLRRTPLRLLLADLNLLLARGGAVPEEKLEAIDSQAAALRAGIREALGKDILDAAERETAPLRAAEALKALAVFRSALQAAYAAGGGKYPASPSELVPDRLPAVPELYLPGHGPSQAVKLINSDKYDKDVSKAAADSGGWLYFAAPGSDNYGLLLIDCTHRHPAGDEFHKY